MLMGTSAILGLTFFGFVYYMKELQAHPMKLIMFMALSESAFLMFLICQFYICESDIN